MKKYSLAILSLTLALSASFSVYAQQYMFTYSKLYSQLKANLKSGHDDVKVGFFFVNALSGELCPITKAWMEKESHYERLKVSEINELNIPLDRHLREANPLIFVDTPSAQQCDFSMVVMAKHNLSEQVSYQQIESLTIQMQTVLDDVSGMFSRWFTPTVQGLTLEFGRQTSGHIRLSNGQVLEILNGQAQVTLAQIGKGGYLVLPRQTTRVLPYLPAAN